MLLIYQIGDVPLFFDLLAKSDDSVSLKTSRDWKVPFADFNGVSGQTFVGDPYRPVVEAQKITISGLFVADDGVSPEKLLRGLHSLGGVPQVPIIAIRYEECLHVDATRCCASCNPTLDWIVNYGIITSIKGDSEYQNTKQSWGSSVADLNITMQIGTKWKELSQYEWDYRNDKTLNPFSQPQTVLTNSWIPQSFDGLRRQYFFYKQDSGGAKYDPSYWGLKYSKSYGGNGSDFVDAGKYPFFVDPQMWSAPPNSVYAITNLLSTSGSVSLKVRRSTGAFSSNERFEESTLDLAQLNTDLFNSGYGGLYASDTIITGYANPFPGFILRDGNILNTKPRWSYQGLYPGETGIGYNEVSISAAGNPIQFAYLHDYGMY